MHDPFAEVSEYLERRTWTQCLGLLGEDDPAAACGSAMSDLNSSGLLLTSDECESLFRRSHCPVCAVEELIHPNSPEAMVTLFSAATRLWNHMPREELGGVSPFEHLRARIEARPTEEPWRVASEDVDKIAHFQGPDFFRGLPNPSEFGIPNEFIDGLFPLPEPMSPPFTRFARSKLGRNQMCPCGSGKKYKRCCGRPGS